jgi:hypothetical protein
VKVRRRGRPRTQGARKEIDERLQAWGNAVRGELGVGEVSNVLAEMIANSGLRIHAYTEVSDRDVETDQAVAKLPFRLRRTVVWRYVTMPSAPREQIASRMRVHVEDFKGYLNTAIDLLADWLCTEPTS